MSSFVAKIFVAIKMILSPDDVLVKALLFLFDVDIVLRWTKKQKCKKFHDHFGSDPLPVADLWYELTHTEIPEAKLMPKEKTRGFKMFMAALYFLWIYPRNVSTFASRFGMCESYARGQNLWKWIGRIAAIANKVIVWSPRTLLPDAPTHVASLDGTDCEANEVKHDTFPKNTGFCSQKLHRCAFKYQITLSAWENQILHIYGPCRGGLDDRSILEESGVLDIVRGTDKRIVVDGGYSNDRNEKEITWPRTCQSKELHNFHSRIRLRHETLNGRLKNFAVLTNRFRHGMTKHGIAFLAVAVVVQYQMNNGARLFSV